MQTSFTVTNAAERILRILCVIFAWVLAQPPVQAATLYDQDVSGSQCDGVIQAGEYGHLSYVTQGVNSGFGNVIGSNSRIYMDSGGGNFTIGMQSGGGSLNDAVVFYLDTIPGGFGDTNSINDAADHGRAAISGVGTNGGTSKLTFASGFKADYAIAVEYFTANLFRIEANGSLTYLKSAQLTPTSSKSTQQREMPE